MKKHITLIFSALLIATTLFGQTTSKKKMGTVSGTIICAEEKTPLPAASVQFFTLPDTTYKSGCPTDLEGKFTLEIEAGKYLVRFSYVGYLSQDKTMDVAAKKNNKIGTIELAPDVAVLKEALVTADVPPVTMAEDTMVYNSAAYRVPAGSMLEELLKKYPGVEVADDGTIKVNGKTVNRILMKG